MQLANQISGVSELFCWLPAGAYVVVTSPLDEIMQVPIVPPRVEYAVDFLFLCCLDYHWVRFSRWLSADWQWVTIEQGHMENAVVLRLTRQVLFVSILIDDHIYCIQSCKLVMKLLRRPGSLDVPCRYLYFVSKC